MVGRWTALARHNFGDFNLEVLSISLAEFAHFSEIRFVIIQLQSDRKCVRQHRPYCREFYQVCSGSATKAQFSLLAAQIGHK